MSHNAAVGGSIPLNIILIFSVPMSLLHDYKKRLCDIFKKEGLEVTIENVEIPKNKEHGDLAVPCFSFASVMKKNPVEIAEMLAKKLKVGKDFHKVENVGPYLNFHIDYGRISKDILKRINTKKGDFIPYLPKKERKNIMVEFCSPNTNKPLHLGHLRNIMLGESISSIMESRGDNVIRTCLVNDRGIHICKSMVAYEQWGEGVTPKSTGKKGDHLVGDFYVKFADHQDEELDSMAKDTLKRWEEGDRKTMDLWKRMNKWVLDGFGQTYRKLGIGFDKYYYESDMYDKGKDMIMKAYESGKLIERDGAIVAHLEEFGLPDKVLIRSDGTTIYMTQDIYLATLKIEEYNLDSSIYVVGSEQELHFKQLFKILGILGYKQADRCYHMSYGMVNLPEGKMKSREGTVVDADDMVKELERLARDEVYSRDSSLPKVEAEERARKIALAGLKFYLIKQDPVKDMTYDPKASISFEGETGPYVQYTIVRIAGIMEKSTTGFTRNVDLDRLEEAELDLVSEIVRFEDVLENAYDKMRPNLIANYLIELSQRFNGYYHSTKIVNTGMEKERIYLIRAISIILTKGLELLGIEVPDKM